MYLIFILPDLYVFLIIQNKHNKTKFKRKMRQDKNKCFRSLKMCAPNDCRCYRSAATVRHKQMAPLANNVATFRLCNKNIWLNKLLLKILINVIFDQKYLHTSCVCTFHHSLRLPFENKWYELKLEVSIGCPVQGRTNINSILFFIFAVHSYIS